MAESTPAPIDRVNRAIIELLQADGRRPYADIAKEVGLSEAAVRQRVKRLVDKGVIQIVAVTDQLQTGYHRPAMVMISVDGDLEAAAAALEQIDKIDYLVRTTGDVDFIAEVATVDDDDLLAVVGEIRAVAGVRNTQTYVYFKIHKQTFQWGPR